jgi:hypothetical protein
MAAVVFAMDVDICSDMMPTERVGAVFSQISVSKCNLWRQQGLGAK